MIATPGTAVITAANTLAPASFVNPLPLSLISLSGLQPKFTGSGADQRLALTFSIMGHLLHPGAPVHTRRTRAVPSPPTLKLLKPDEQRGTPVG